MHRLRMSVGEYPVDGRTAATIVSGMGTDRLRQEDSRSPTEGRAASDWRWPLVVLAACFLLLTTVAGVVVFVLWQTQRAAEGVGKVAERAVDVARGLHSGTITERFIASLPEIDASGMGRLELATFDAVETFQRTDERRVLWEQVPLGTTVAEIRVPVTYRYHVRLEDPWRLEVEDGVCRVWAPRVYPSQPPAIHTDRLERRVDEGWLRFDGDEQLDALQATITPTLASMARHPTKIAAVRDSSRATVARFVRAFLLREGLWAEDRLAAIQVLFEGESPEPEAVEVSITFEESPG